MYHFAPDFGQHEAREEANKITKEADGILYCIATHINFENKGIMADDNLRYFKHLLCSIYQFSVIYIVYDYMMTYRMGKLEAYLENNVKSGMSGDSFGPGKWMRLADLKVGNTLELMFVLYFLDAPDAEKLMAPFPRLTALVERVSEFYPLLLL